MGESREVLNARAAGGRAGGDDSRRRVTHPIRLCAVENPVRTNDRIAICVALLLGVVLAAAAGCNRQTTAAGFQMPPPLVTVTPATARDVPVYLDEIGRNGAFESVTVTPQVSGRITERHFEDGADLKKDQLLFTIDPRPFQAVLDSAQAQLAQSKAALDLANSQLKMYASIAGTKAVSQLDYETKKNSVEVDEAQMQAGQAAVETAKLNLEYCYIHSPIDGRAGMRLVDVGNVVQANSTALLSVQHLDPIYADFTITERDLPQVRQEMARGTLKTMVRVPSDPPNSARAGSLTFLDNIVQNATGTVNLRATVRNPDHHFWPGQFVDVTLILSTVKGAVLVPNQATELSQQGTFVYVVKPDGTADLRPVTLGQRQGEDVVVASGVAAGESVVVTGQMTVHPGGKVRIDTGAPGGMPGGAPGAAPTATQSATPSRTPPGAPAGVAPPSATPSSSSSAAGGGKP
jgi:membrane fusion protein, multidrug efflux system